MRDDVERAVLDFVKKYSPGLPGKINCDSKIGELGLDSLKLVEIVFELENLYSMEADEERLVRLETIGDIIDMVCEA